MTKKHESVEEIESHEGESDIDVEETVTDPEARITALEEELAQTRDRMLRCAADFDNFKKRAERERIETVNFANERLLRDLLPMADGLDRAILSVGQADTRDAIVEGLRLVLTELLHFLRKHGTEPIETQGKPFDPQVHEAVQMVDNPDAQNGTILEEIQKGYLLNGRVLRPALVVVARNVLDSSTKGA